MTPTDPTNTFQPDPNSPTADAPADAAADSGLDAGLAAAFGSDDTAGATADFAGKDEHVGAILGGKYKLIEAIGEGGMGSVYMALQTEPVKRAVAVKVIKAGMDSKAVLARFEAERQALALMDHPNIARVLDAGTTESGRPYFVMELVKGVPITQFCDERKLTPRQRLELFVPVCNAIQHAHQKGVIHRDIKPSNVLVALYDDRPVPKVIDFGVAKAAGQTLTDKTLMTGFGAVVGTPEYMSPEQANLNNLDIDTRSDVYSLGVLLYELLTGSTPVDRKSLGKAALLEILRIVREVEAPRPSQKLSTSDALPSISANRGTEPKKLTGLLRSELDWIVLKALEKDRTRRYETANGFAADVQRFLSGEPVQAHPPSASYRLRKFVNRNRVQVIAAGLVFAALVAGVVGTTLGLREAQAQRDIAHEHEVEAKRQEAEAFKQATTARANEAVAVAAKEEEARLRAVAEAEKRRAIDNGNSALDALRATTGSDVELLIGEKKELTAREKAYLLAIIGRWKTFARRQEIDEQSRAIQAEGHLQVASLLYTLGRREEARTEFEQAVATYGRLAADFPDKADYRKRLSESHNGLNFTLSDVGQLEEALKQCRESLRLLENLAADFPNSVVYRASLAQCHNNIGLRLSELGQTAEAVEQYKRTLVLKEKLVAEFPTPQLRASLAKTHDNLGVLLSSLGKRPEAREQHEKALDLFGKLVNEDPTVPERRQDLAKCHLNVGQILSRSGNRLAAEEHHRKCLGLQEKLVAEFPSIPEYRHEMSVCHHALGVLLIEDPRKRPLAEEQFRKALALREQLVTEFPKIPQYRRLMADSQLEYGIALAGSGRRTEAEPEFRKALVVYEKLAADFPKELHYPASIGNACYNLGLLSRENGQLAESLEWMDRAVKALQPVVDAQPRVALYRRYLLNSYRGRANTRHALEKYAEAVQDWDKALGLEPQQPGFRTKRALSRSKAGMVAEAVAEVAELTNVAGAPPDIVADFACVYSVASGKIEGKKAEYADRAIGLLARAVKLGYRDTARLRTDPDLDPLRNREDFKTLLADLEKKFPPPKELAPPPKAVK